METHRYPDADDAAAALQDVHDGRQAAARRITTPWWYHPLVGLALAAVVGSGSLPSPIRILALVAASAALLALFALYRRLTGLWINTLDVPGMERVTRLAMGVVFVVYATALAVEELLDVPGAMVGAGVLLGTAYTFYWRWVERRLIELWQAAP